jgi:hypothetical protein
VRNPKIKEEVIMTLEKLRSSRPSREGVVCVHEHDDDDDDDGKAVTRFPSGPAKHESANVLSSLAAFINLDAHQVRL